MHLKMLSFFLLTVFISYGQSPSREGDLYMVIDTAKEEYGYINAKKKVVIPFGNYPLCYTDTIKTIGFVLVRKEGFWAIDKRENKLFRVVPLGNAPDRISEGLFRIQDDNGLMGFANMDGEVVIPPTFSIAHPFREGMAVFCDNCKYEPHSDVNNPKRGQKLKGKFGFINKQGEVVIQPTFGLVHSFSDGMAAFCNDCEYGPSPDGHNQKKGSKKLKGKFGFINKKGEIVIPPTFDQVAYFIDGKCLVWKEGEKFYINKKGEKIEKT